MVGVPGMGGHSRYGRFMRAALLIVVLLLVGGCTSEQVGSAPAEPTGLSLPPRPRDLRIDGVEPCSLLTAQQRTELGLEQRASPFVDDSSLYRGRVPSCLLRGGSPRAVSVTIGIVTSVGIERFSEGDIAAYIENASVGGYPAIIAIPQRVKDYCNVEVDVARGQLVDVLYGDVALDPPISQRELCDGGVEVAEAVLSTLTGS